MDNRVRLNEICIIGQPRCGYAFASTRSCFIGYPFGNTNLEVQILSQILQDRGIEPIQAGDHLVAGQNVFCTKICSKIITAQFCAVFANNGRTRGKETPNANVHVEYGMMLAFNKLVIPFQLEGQKLAFNIAGLDTVKYSASDFMEKAEQAVDGAIAVSTPEGVPMQYDLILEAFFIANDVLPSPIDNDGERLLYNRGKGLGYSLLNDFTGWSYKYFGVFTNLTPQAIWWRLQKTSEILDGISASVELHLGVGFAVESQAKVIREAMSRFGIWIVVADATVRERVLSLHRESALRYPITVFLDSEVREQFDRIASGAAFSDPA